MNMNNNTMPFTIKVALIGDFNPSVTAHIAIPKAIAIASKENNQNVEGVWVETKNLSGNIDHLLAEYSGIWCVPGSPYKNVDGALSAIQYARERKIPFLGTCGGYQHAILEYARHLGFAEADSVEVNPDASIPLIAPLSCALIEANGNILFSSESQVGQLYGTKKAVEKYRCSYGLNVKYVSIFAESDLLIAGVDSQGDPQVIELKNHPFFIGTGYQPERSALLDQRHPLITAFVKAIVAQQANVFDLKS
jgi:CTP synthase (UTP-ammonia lyase)